MIDVFYVDFENSKRCRRNIGGLVNSIFYVDYGLFYKLMVSCTRSYLNKLFKIRFHFVENLYFSNRFVKDRQRGLNPKIGTRGKHFNIIKKNILVLGSMEGGEAGQLS